MNTQVHGVMTLLSWPLSGEVIALTLASALALALAPMLVMWRRSRGRRQGAARSMASHFGAHARPNKIIVFYSSIGHGHISAAQAIQDEIVRQDPAARVILQDIRAFMHPVWRRIDERLYWFVANHLPESFESLFRSLQARGNRVSSLSLLPNDYPEEKVLAYLASQAPQAVLATHYGSAQVLGTLRDRGLLPDVRIGWLHTDFFEGYLPRISKRIDRTFLAHAELESRWLAAGVAADKVATSGMAVRIPADEPGARQRTLARLGLSPDAPTLLLTGGKEGAGDYAGVVQSIARHCPGRVQIIAACGTNARHQTALTALQADLPPQVTLKVLGLLAQPDMVACMRAADLLITKAGGMTPAEAFAMGTPTILLDVVSGHERENAAMFVRLGLAELVTDAAQAGPLVADFLAHPRKREAMLSAQREFRDNANIAGIAQFALDESFITSGPLPDLGVENGSPALDIDEALARFEWEVPADIELLLSYATSRTPQRIVRENPFGHLAIRVGNTVYSANYVADRQIDPNLLQHLTLADYLYGVQRPSRSQVHTNTYGMAYGRETISLRVAGVPANGTAAMVAEAHRIEEEFGDGSLHWDRSDFNCADVVARILLAGGFGGDTLLDYLRLPAMPLDVFEQARTAFEADAALRVDLVAYRQMPGTQASYRFSRFPLSLGQPLRSVARVLSDAPRDPLETAVTRQLTAYFGDRRLSIEDLRARSSTSGLDDPARLGLAHLRLEKAIVADLRRLLAVNAKLSVQEIERLGDVSVQEIRRLIDRCQELARLATELAEEILLYPHAHRLRTQFTQLVNDYGRIGTRRLRARQVRAYMKRLQAFATALAQEFSRIEAARTRDAWATWRSLPRWVGRLRRRLLGRRLRARRKRNSKRNSDPHT